MPVQILSTKLFIPPLRSRLVARPRLIEKLNQGLECGMMLISAPAGYGKTTLLSAWLDQCSYPATWISLDENDNDIAGFLTYLVAAVQKIQAQAGKDVLTMLQSPQTLQANLLVSALINEIAQINDHFVFVLDDYHTIREQTIHQAVGYLVDHLPRQMHLVISTRADPALPLARLRGRAQLMELRQADLCFTAEEAGEFFRQSIGVSISSEDINILTARAEGWITGLQMAAVSMRGCEDVSHFVQSFTGSNRYLLDYLMEEVFERQTEVIRDFLLKTSILNRLNGSLCNAVTGGTDGQSILETLDRANLFVVPLDETRFWYRYHNLFSELLRLRLQRTYPELAATLHQRASGWYERHGFTSEAIDQAISGGAYNRAGQLIEKTADSTLMHGRVRTFLNWMESLPDEVVCHLPLLSMYHAEALLFSGSSLDKVSKRLESASIYNAVQALSASYRGDIEHSKKLSERVLKDLPKEYVFLRGAITSSLGALFMLSGDVKPAIRSFRSAAEIGRESKNLMLEVIALSRMGQLYLTLGELQKAEEFLRKAVELSSTQPGTYLPIASMPMTHLAYLLLEKYELDSASSFIEKAVELSQESGGFWTVDSYVVSAFVSQAKGDFNGAIEAIGMARKVAYRTEANQIDDVYTAAYEAQLFAAQGNLPAALTWIRENHLNWQEEEGNGSVKNRVNPLLYHLLEVEQMTLAKICLAQGKSNEALGILVSIFSESEKRERRMSVMENLILQALAYQAQGDLSAALQKLAHVLSMASIEGYMRIFVDKGQPMKQLLKAAAEREINLAYVTALLELFRDAKTASAIRVLPCSLVEKLSMRELEILKLLAQRYSDKYIATTLVISRETVHKHLQNIYGKLGVHSRTEAVARAYELGILLAPLKE